MLMQNLKLVDMARLISFEKLKDVIVVFLWGLIGRVL